ncbi:MAG: cytochrome c [Bacteroidota bacterium]|nr:cytochrome c [Bacteroidota bacterium]
MTITFQSFIILSIIYLIVTPAFLKAQNERKSNNHCGVQKSSFRISVDSGRVVYIKQCLSCHQADGMGNANISPPLSGKVITGDKKKLIEIIINGQDKNEEIKGKTYQNSMPTGPVIKDQENADVTTYIRSSFGNKGSVVKVSEVNSIRNILKER